jgi:cathepsin B
MGKFTVLAAVAGIVPALGGDFPTPSGKTKVNDESLIDYYNKIMGSTWTAGHNDFFHGMNFDDARPLLGTHLEHNGILDHLNATLENSVYDAIADEDVPTDFDARTKWPDLIHPIRDQQHCGSCWAFSASEVLSDRVAIATGKKSPVLSAEDMVSCDRGDMGCQGGRLANAWSYLKETGIVTDTCFPYTAGDGTAPQCVTKCADSETFTRTKVQDAYAINGVANMQKEIMTKGPIQVAFTVYKSFMSYKTGVYQKHWYEFLPEGGHAVKIVGWGTESGTDYWLVANSWNTNWGLDGYFKIRRGVNACGMETQGPPYAGTVATSSSGTVVV